MIEDLEADLIGSPMDDSNTNDADQVELTNDD